MNPSGEVPNLVTENGSHWMPERHKGRGPMDFGTMTKKQLKRYTRWGWTEARLELAQRIGPERAVAVWNSTAYRPGRD